MELVYRNKLVHYLGSDEEDDQGSLRYTLAFRDGSGEKFFVCLSQEQLPNHFFACHSGSFERALQKILDRHEGL